MKRGRVDTVSLVGTKIDARTLQETVTCEFRDVSSSLVLAHLSAFLRFYQRALCHTPPTHPWGHPLLCGRPCATSYSRHTSQPWALHSERIEEIGLGPLAATSPTQSASSLRCSTAQMKVHLRRLRARTYRSHSCSKISLASLRVPNIWAPLTLEE